LGCLDREMFRCVTGGLGLCLSVGPLDFPLWDDGASRAVGQVEDGTKLRRSVLCLAPKQPFLVDLQEAIEVEDRYSVRTTVPYEILVVALTRTVLL